MYREDGANREIAASDFFLGPMVTALPQGACLVEARFPVWAEPRVGAAFHEVNARQSDFAFVSAAAQIAVDPNGNVLVETTDPLDLVTLESVVIERARKDYPGYLPIRADLYGAAWEEISRRSG